MSIRYPLEEYGLTVRTMNVMRKHDLLTREDVVILFPRRFYQLTGLGQTGRQELITRLAITETEKHPKRKESRDAIINDVLRLHKDIILRINLADDLVHALQYMTAKDE